VLVLWIIDAVVEFSSSSSLADLKSNSEAVGGSSALVLPLIGGDSVRESEERCGRCWFCCRFGRFDGHSTIAEEDFESEAESESESELVRVRCVCVFNFEFEYRSGFFRVLDGFGGCSLL